MNLNKWHKAVPEFTHYTLDELTGFWFEYRMDFIIQRYVLEPEKRFGTSNNKKMAIRSTFE